jgi:triosephosphate isomerase
LQLLSGFAFLIYFVECWKICRSQENAIVAVAAAAIGATVAMVIMNKKKIEAKPVRRETGSKKGTPIPKSKKRGSFFADKPTSTRRYLIGGNWKCHGTCEENDERVKVMNEAGTIPENVDVVLCVPYIHIAMCLTDLRADIEVGAQNCGKNPGDGAFTGEIGAYQLADVGCTWVIVGHSERRMGFGMSGETEELCAEKCKIALDKGLKVMFAIGEQYEERQNETTMKVCAAQLEPLVKLLEPKDWENVAIAYEPVWAIGTGLCATPEMAQETHAQIRNWIKENVSKDVANAVRIQYGGSMKGANAEALLKQPDIDGGLIGGASLKADFFNVINGVPK